jgi:hypothetical protein
MRLLIFIHNFVDYYITRLTLEISLRAYEVLAEICFSNSVDDV